MANFCTNCGKPLEKDAKFCVKCGTQVEQIPKSKVPKQKTQPKMNKPAQSVVSQNMWHQNQYKIRKKVLSIGNKYWIEDYAGNLLGFCKQKVLKLKEDIRIFSDESMTQELFNIKQEQIFDAWGSFAISDSMHPSNIGYIRRGFLSELGRDAWELQDANRRPIGRIFEQSLGRALARKYMPGGGLVPEKMQIELNGNIIAEVNQKFKIIGDIWDMNIFKLPENVDRRILIAAMLMMGNIERDRK